SFFFLRSHGPMEPLVFPTRRSSDLATELKQHFRPEFLNRVDEVIVFPPLTQDEILQMVDMMVGSLEERLAEKDIDIELTQAAKRSEEHTSELQSRENLVCRLLLEKK